MVLLLLVSSKTATSDVTVLHTATMRCCCSDSCNNIGDAAFSNATAQVMKHLLVQHRITLLPILRRLPCSASTGCTYCPKLNIESQAFIVT